MYEIDLIVEVLKSGEWCELDKIAERCGLSERKVKSILKFLNEYGFVKINCGAHKVKAESSLLKFLQETQNLEKVRT